MNSYSDKCKYPKVIVHPRRRMKFELMLRWVDHFGSKEATLYLVLREPKAFDAACWTVSSPLCKVSSIRAIYDWNEVSVMGKLEEQMHCMKRSDEIDTIVAWTDF